ncbi:MAG TPA: HAD family phosphatase [Bacteroidales bacterium]|nr:HAD family phosphatase [Bacteroidales bacterium]
MIKNIIFDLGNVLLNFRPAEFLEKKNYPEDIRTTILTDIFESKEWLMIDNGDLTISEAIDSIARRSSLPKEEIARIFDLRIELMFPLDRNVKLLPELKKRGFKLYILSNFSLDGFEAVNSLYSFFRYFDGGVISSKVKLCKPDRRIYETLMKKYSLIPEECFFIDDIETNVRAAELAGMKGLVTYGSQDIFKEVEEQLTLS